LLVLVTVCLALKVLLLAKDLKPRSIGGCRSTKPEDALGSESDAANESLWQRVEEVGDT